MSIGHHGATPGRHDDRSARSIAGRGRKGLRLIPLSRPIPEARPQPEIAARSAETAPRTRCQRVRACVLRTRASPCSFPNETDNRAGSALQIHQLWEWQLRAYYFLNNFGCQRVLRCRDVAMNCHVFSTVRGCSRLLDATHSRHTEGTDDGWKCLGLADILPYIAIR